MTALEAQAPPNAYDLNEILISWKSMSHPYKKRTPLYYQTLVAFALLISIVSYFVFSSVLLVGGITSTAFVLILMSTLPPIEVEHTMTPSGFINAGRFYHWYDLYGFWFEKKWEYNILIIQSRLSFPAQVQVIVSDKDKEAITKIISKYLIVIQNPQKGLVQKLADAISNKLPLEATHTS